MELRRVDLQHFKGIRALAEEFAPGLNCVFGPNEAGKSTFLQALRAAFFGKPRRKEDESWELVPWGTSEVPVVRVEFSSGGRHYRLIRELDPKKMKVELHELGGEHEKLVSRSRSGVQEKLAEILHDLDDVGFLRTAWARQGAVLEAIDGLPDLEGCLATARYAAGSVDVAEVEKKVEDRIRELGKGLERPAKEPGPIKRLETEIDAARRRHEDLAESLAEGRKSEEEAEREADELKAAEAGLGELAPTVGRDADYLRAKGEHDAAVERLKLAEKELSEARRAQESVSALEKGRAGLEEKLAAGEKKVGEAELLLKAAKAEEERAGLDARIASVRSIEQKAAALRPEAERPCPDGKQLSSLLSLPTSIAELRATVRAAELRVSIDPLRRIDVVGPGAASETLLPGRPKEVSGDSPLEFEIEGVARIRASGPAPEDLPARRKELEKNKARLAEALERYGASSADELRQHASKVSDARRELKGLEAERGRLLKGKALQALEDESAGCVETARSVAGPVPGVEQARQARDSAMASREGLRTELKLVGRQLEEGRGRPGDLPEIERRMGEFAVAEQRARYALSMLEPFALPPAKRSELDSRRRTVEKRVTELKYRARHRQEFGDRGTPTGDRLADAAAKVEEIERQLGALRCEISAYRMVQEAINEARGGFAGSIAEPLARSLSSLLPRLTMKRYESPALSEDLSIETVSGPAAEGGAPVEGLSVGAREQVALALRLALVEALSRGERQLVVLDEALIGFDPERTAAACEILAEYASRFQILVLTARPGTLVFPEGTEVRMIDLGASG